MGLGTPVQRDPTWKSKYHKWLKNATNRMLRRKAKNDPENAPKKKYYKGYES